MVASLPIMMALSSMNLSVLPSGPVAGSEPLGLPPTSSWLRQPHHANTEV